MRITGADCYVVGNPWKNWVFVRVETDEGIYGIGEGTLNGFARTTEACIRELAPFYMGMDPFQIEIIVQKMVRDVYSEGGQIHRNAVAAITPNSNAAPPAPRTSPMTNCHAPCVITMRKMRAASAPNAMRIPNSCLLWFTEKVMTP